VRFRVAVTDDRWFQMLASDPGIEELNFWQPGGSRQFGALGPGELFLFKLHSPKNFIVGGGVFAYSTLLPLRLAWDSFGRANGAASLEEMKSRIARYRKDRRGEENPQIGCILLTQPFFLPEALWIPAPKGWSRNIVQGKNYDSAEEPGRSLFESLRERLAVLSLPAPYARLELPEAEARYGKPVLITPRLGQGTFRVLVTDAYSRRCALTGEKVLPVLQAAHIRPFAQKGPHSVDNGLLLRSDLHTLFDQGYITVTPSGRLEVSRRIYDEFHNGQAYYALRGGEIRLPAHESQRPLREHLTWHNENVFRS
jgi:putative restriction endonuclease